MVKIFTMVKSEDDIVEEWVLYHGCIFGFKNLFVIDNYSSDETYKKLLKLRDKYSINVCRLPDYRKKGEYMTQLFRTFCNCEIGIPIDIDEFIVYYDKKRNNISCNPYLINNFIKQLPQCSVFKMNYIQSKLITDNADGYKNATIEAKCGWYDDRGTSAKSFFNSKLFKGIIDHGNHYHTNNYFMTNLCLVHFHTRNINQIRTKVFNNLKGLGHNPFNLIKLKETLKSNPSIEGYHHLNKQISILENTFNLPSEVQKLTDISLEEFNNYISYLLSKNNT
jgi:hypothetical protein